METHFRTFKEYPAEGGWSGDTCEGIEGLEWIKQDSGAWTGPLKNWRADHKDFMSQVKEFNTVVMAGGNCGMYPRFYGNYFSTVITFEPCPNNFACLDKNCDGPKYRKFLGGLGNTTDKLSLKHGGNSNVGTHRIGKEAGDVQMYKLDDLNLERCDLIHLDVEGYEEDVLRGAEKTIRKYKPIVITERSSGEAFLLSLGYNFHKKLQMDTVYIPV